MVKINYKLEPQTPLVTNPNYRSVEIVTQTICCQRMDKEWKDHVRLTPYIVLNRPEPIIVYIDAYEGYDEGYDLELQYCPWCAEKIELADVSSQVGIS